MRPSLPFLCNKSSRLGVRTDPLPSLKPSTGSRLYRLDITRATGTRNIPISEHEDRSKHLPSPPHTPANTLLTFPALPLYPLVCIYRVFFADADGTPCPFVCRKTSPSTSIPVSLSNYHFLIRRRAARPDDEWSPSPYVSIDAPWYLKYLPAVVHSSRM